MLVNELPKFPRLEYPSTPCCTAIPDNAVRSAHSQQQLD